MVQAVDNVNSIIGPALIGKVYTASVLTFEYAVFYDCVVRP